MQQGLHESNAALQAAQSHLSARQEEVLELTQRLEAAQADIASLQVETAQHHVMLQVSNCLAIVLQRCIAEDTVGLH